MKKFLVITGFFTSVLPAFGAIACDKKTKNNNEGNQNNDNNQGRERNQDEDGSKGGSENQDKDENKGNDREPTQAEKDLLSDWEASSPIDGENKDKKSFFIKHSGETFSQTVAKMQEGLNTMWKTQPGLDYQKDIKEYIVLIFNKNIYLLINTFTSYVALKYLNNETIVKNVFDVSPLNFRDCGITTEREDQTKHFENIVYNEWDMTFVFKNWDHQNYAKWQYDKDANTLTLLEAKNAYE